MALRCFSDHSAFKASAILYDAGLVAAADAAAPWTAIAWTNLSDKIVRSPATEVWAREALPVKVRSRLIVFEGIDGGSVAIVPPQQYFYPLDSVDNLASAWAGRGYRGMIEAAGFGVRQTVDGDKRWVPWMNAPPASRQDLGVFYLLSDGNATQATADALAYTHGDTFKPVEGCQTFSSHYHVEHAVDFMKRQEPSKSTPTASCTPT